MIITGDIAVPSQKYAKQLNLTLNKNKDIFIGQEIICNLEGLLIDDYFYFDNSPVLYNHNSVISVLKQWNLKVAGLANNHTLDLTSRFNKTINSLKEAGISYAGADLTEDGAFKPAIFFIEGKKHIVFNQCWHVMLQHQKNPENGVYVATIDEENLLHQVKDYRNSDPEASIIIYFHWNFDLETLPFPAHRQLAKDLIDYGGNVVVGCHSHSVQGGEQYKDGYIVYGLGNFFVPWFTFINGTINFPDFARIEMAFEWNPVSNDAKCHWFKYHNTEDDKHELEHLGTESFSDGNLISKYSPFSGMSHEEYIPYFKKHRRKKGGVPVYLDYRSKVKNTLFDYILIYRIRFARLLAKMKLRGWNN